MIIFTAGVEKRPPVKIAHRRNMAIFTAGAKLDFGHLHTHKNTYICLYFIFLSVQLYGIAKAKLIMIFSNAPNIIVCNTALLISIEKNLRLQLQFTLKVCNQRQYF